MKTATNPALDHASNSSLKSVPTSRRSAKESWCRTGNRLLARLAALSVVMAGAVGVGIGLGVLPGSARADQILQVYGETLTNYKPAAASAAQGAWPLHQQRGVNLDGSPRAMAALAWAFAGNPLNVAGAESWNANERMGDLRVDLGTYAPTDVDLALPSAGFRWVVARSYNGVQLNAMSAHRDSDGPQGKNWFQMSQPELVFYTGGTADKDVVYIVYGADRYLEFQRTGVSSTVFQGKNGAAGVVSYSSGSPDTYSYTDQVGNVTVFFGGNTSSGRADWQLWKMTDPAGNVAFVGDASTASTAVTSGYNTDKTIATAYDSAAGGNRRYWYTYTTIDGVKRLTRVKAETKTSGSWASPSGLATVGQVDYDYYQTGDNTYGDNGNLKLVTVTTPLSDPSQSQVKKKYYRYWKGTYNSSTNPGNPNTIQLVVGFEGARKYDWDQDGNLDDDFLTASLANLKPYSEAYLEYAGSSDYRISKAFFNGECGCSGGNNGQYTLSYDVVGGGAYATYIGNTSYDTVDPDGAGPLPAQAVWATRTIMTRPDSTFETRYFDETGQPMGKVITDTTPTGSPSVMWGTDVIRNADGQLTEVRTPSNITAYTHSTGVLTESSSVGLIQLYTRLTSTDVKGFVEYGQFKDAGTSGTPAYTSEQTYSTLTMNVGSSIVTRPLANASSRYAARLTVLASPPAGAVLTTSVSSTAYSGTLSVQQATVTNPTVASGNNGSGSSTATDRYLNTDGTTQFTKNTQGILTYMGYVNGQVTTSVQDADTTTLSGGGVSLPPGLSTSGTALHYVTTYTYDAQGRPETTTTPDGRVMVNLYTKLVDQRMVTLSFPRKTTGPTTYFGPVSYTVTNHAGKAEFSGTIAVTSSGSTTALGSWIDSTTSDPIAAVLVGTLKRMNTSVYNSAGTRLQESRNYVLIPGSGAGSAGTNYDPTVYGYDDMGRRWRVKDPTGTITRSVYDTLGRTVETWLGTNDSNFTGGEPSGTPNMTQTSATEYDGGSDKGNSYVTKRSVDADGNWGTTGDRRETVYSNDARGRAILVTNPQSPHVLSNYDNLGRVTASATYSSTASITVGTTDPKGSATNDKANRLGLNETFYDERGQVWKTVRHSITLATGVDADSVTSQNWYDPEGRAIKRRAESGLSKTRYDRLGRVTHSFTLAADNDSTTYSNVYSSGQTDVAGDTVLQEDQTTYDNANKTGLALMRATISRFHDDVSTTTTALDTNADGLPYKYTAADVKGRLQVTAMWYDALDRLTDTAVYGTNGSGNVTTFDRSGLSVPSRSDTVLVTSQSYNDDGTVLDVTDPRGKVTRTLYDDAKRRVATISNYVNGTPSGANGDDDNYVRYVYANGLQTQMWVDLDGDNVQDADDQVTVYTFGTVKGGSAGDSQVQTGNLLQKIAYPDSSGPSDTVTKAYNALGQEIWSKDQAGTVVETALDTGGRTTQRRVTTLAGGLDNAVLRIALAYTSRGQTDTVTQYNNATVGSGSVTDQVQYAYDDWGNVSTFTQDVDSAIGGSGRASFAVSYSYTKKTPSGGHDYIARTGMTLPGSGDSNTITYTYSSSSSIDEVSGRVTSIKTGSGGGTTRVSYAYLGVAQVVGTDLAEPSSYSRLYGTGTANYDALDRFNRTTLSRWTKSLGTPRNFYEVALGYDRDSNITVATDAVHPGYDASYSMDGRNRLTRAEEGTWSGSAITGTTRDQQWTLSQPGNWSVNKLDIDGDGLFTGGGELNDTGTFNVANELTARDTDTNGSPNYTLSYDAVGNQTDDGKDYTYVYDAFGRMTKVSVRGGGATVAEYRYNGLNFRISTHSDLTRSGGGAPDGTVDSNDPTYYLTYDERWRQVATFRGTDSDPKERFVWHNAGLAGKGGSSYIDAVVLRDRDLNSGWTSAADGTLEERFYYCQNWRADVSVIMSSAGQVKEWVKYSAYGVPMSITPADFDGDGFVTGDDDTAFNAAYGLGTWNARTDLDLDGTIDSDDATIWGVEFGAGEAGGRGVLSRASVANKLGYAGYQHAPELIGAKWHVRNRVLDSDTGRWSRRDPLGYVDGLNLVQYTIGNPILLSDHSGLSIACGCFRCLGQTTTALQIDFDNIPFDPPGCSPWHDYDKLTNWLLRMISDHDKKACSDMNRSCSDCTDQPHKCQWGAVNFDESDAKVCISGSLGLSYPCSAEMCFTAKITTRTQSGVCIPLLGTPPSYYFGDVINMTRVTY